MPGKNIARSEAQERSKHLKVDSYVLTLDVTHGRENFIATSTVRFSCNTPGYDTFIDAVGKRIISATLNGQPVDTSHYDGETVFIKNLAAQNELTIEMEANFSKNGEGLQLSTDPADDEVYLYSQGETAYIRSMFPCFDQPDLKATFQLTAIAPDHWEVISNAPLKAKKDLGGKKAMWEFNVTQVIPTYNTALIAGPYFHVHDEYRGKKVVPLGIYCRKSLAPSLDPDDIFLITKQGFEYFEKVFGLAYPFEKYDQIAVLDFNWGAMENAGCVTFLERLLVFRSKVTNHMYSERANVILHEMAHMWFGNMVTMRWWDDLWLNESFAEFSSYLAASEATRFKDSWTSFNSSRKNWAYRQDQLSSTHPIVTDMVDIETVNANFDGITYAKGASVLQQLVHHVGRDNFINGLKKYFEKHAWKNTTLNDLLVELEATSGRDLKPWVSTWLQTSGVNILRPEIVIEDGSYSSITIKQEAPKVPAGSTELRPHRMAVGLHDLVGDALTLRLSVELDVAGEKTVVDSLKGEKVADLLLLNDRDLTYSKIRFDERSIATLKSHLGKIKDPLTRALCWSTAWDMHRDAELSASDFVTIATAGLPFEENISVVTTIATQLNTVVELYAPEKDRDTLREKVASAFESMMEKAKPGSDFQLQFARSFAGFATTANQNAKIKDLLNGKLQGLNVDADLRWVFVIALIERGLFTKTELDQERANDKTVNGELNYELGLVAFPDAQAKAAAWKSLTTEELTNSIRLSRVNGFMRSSQRELLKPYVDQYFDHLLAVWDRSSYEAASTFVEMLYPIYITTQETLDKTNRWLESTGKDAPSGLKRLVNEARDGMARALRVQALG